MSNESNDNDKVNDLDQNNIESDSIEPNKPEAISLEDMPKDESEKSKKEIIREKIIFYFYKSKQALADLLDLKHIEAKLPKEWQEKLPENRRILTLPLFILFCGFLLIFLLAVFAPRASTKTSEKYIPTVKVIKAVKQDLHIPVYSQGMISPKHEVKLISLVRGPVTYVSPNFVDGGYVAEGELLLSVSDRTYLQDKALVEANLARAKAAQVARQSELRVRGTLRTDAGVSQLREVNSAVKAAEADVEKIDDLIAATQFKAPFSGLIRGANINVGQMINAGSPIAAVFSIDTVIVSLPLSDKQLNLVSLPDIIIRNIPRSDSTQGEEKNVAKNIEKDSDLENKKQNFPSVKIMVDFDGQNYYWTGKLVRSAGGRNELNRLQYVIVEIDKPYAKDESQPNRPPLSPGLFVQAQIEGRLLKDIIKLPRKTLKANQKIWGVNAEGVLQSFDVELIYKGKEFIYVSKGIETDANIIITDLEVLAEGVEVKSIVEKSASLNKSTQDEIKESSSKVIDSESDTNNTQGKEPK